MMFYNLQNSVKLPPKMQEMAFHGLLISTLGNMSLNRPDVSRAFVAQFDSPPQPPVFSPWRRH